MDAGDAGDDRKYFISYHYVIWPTTAHSCCWGKYDCLAGLQFGLLGFFSLTTFKCNNLCGSFFAVCLAKSRQMSLKIVQSPINHQIWSHCLFASAREHSVTGEFHQRQSANKMTVGQSQCMTILT